MGTYRKTKHSPRFGENTRQGGKTPGVEPLINRRRFLKTSLLLGGLAGASGLFIAVDPYDWRLNIPQEAIDRAKGASARFNVYFPNSPQGRVKVSNGSGFYFKAKDNAVYYLTNEHNIGDFAFLGARIPTLGRPVFTIQMEDGTEFETQVVASSPRYAYDLAVTRVPDNIGRRLIDENRVIDLANLTEFPARDETLSGQPAFFCGYPGDGPQTIKTGRILDVNETGIQEIRHDGVTLNERLGAGPRIRTNIPTEHGASGAPLCLGNGQVIGLCNQSGGRSYNFAIPLESIKAFLTANNIPVLEPEERSRVDVNAFRQSEQESRQQLLRRQGLFIRLLRDTCPQLPLWLAQRGTSLEVIPGFRVNYENFDLFLTRHNLPDQGLSPSQYDEAKRHFRSYFRSHPLMLLTDPIPFP